MTASSLDLVFVGLSLSSSWGNGHATTYRALLQGLAARGHRIHFLEREAPWYRDNRDLPDPDFCALSIYDDVAEFKALFQKDVARADAVVVGSFVEDGANILDFVLANARGTKIFYDIDTPVTLAGLRRDDLAFLKARQVPELDLYLSFSGGGVLDELTSGFGARKAAAFYCSVDQARYAPSNQQNVWDLGYLGTYSSDRQPMVDRLLIDVARRLPDRGFVVAGPQYPDSIEWPANVERVEHLAPDEHPAFYGRQRFTLNVTRADMVKAGWSPSVRLFEAAACGTPIISDRWQGLGDLLPENQAVLIADETQNVVDALTGLDEAVRVALAQNARSIVLGAHTGLARAAEFERLLSQAVDPQRQAAVLTVTSVPAPTDHLSLANALEPAGATQLRHRTAPDRPFHFPTTPTVLVTGGAGFVGSFLCERLVAEGHRVICLDSLRTGALENLQELHREPRFSFLDADICEPLPHSVASDQIFNLACPASPKHYQTDPIHTLLTSVLGTRNLLELARTTGARLVQASTSEIYGDPEQHPQRETYWGNVNPIGPRACYDEGKRAAETLCFDYPRVHQTDVRVARIFNTYGPRLRPDDGRIVSTLIVQSLAGRPLTIYGSGEQTRSFCFVTDLVDGMFKLMNVAANPSGPINLGNPEEYTINELAQIVLGLTGSRSPVVYEPLPADDPQLRRPDVTRARELLNWQPQTSVQKGLQTTIAWFDGQNMATQGERRQPALPSASVKSTAIA